MYAEDITKAGYHYDRDDADDVIDCLQEQNGTMKTFIRNLACEYSHDNNAESYLTSPWYCCRARRLLEEIDNG